MRPPLRTLRHELEELRGYGQGQAYDAGMEMMKIQEIPDPHANESMRLKTCLSQYNRYEQNREAMYWVRWKEMENDPCIARLWLVRVRVSGRGDAQLEP